MEPRRIVELQRPLGRALLRLDGSLPDPKPCKTLWLDFETTSFSQKERALNPWLGHRVVGAALCRDDEPAAHYVPIRGRGGPVFGFDNCPPDRFAAWLRDQLGMCEEWGNHNVKFDAHFAAADGVELPYNLELRDTSTPSKLADSDRRDHDLKSLSAELLGVDWGSKDEVAAFLEACKSKDYGDCPPAILGPYACDDVLAARALSAALDRKLEELDATGFKLPSGQGLVKLWERERRFTRVLYDAERRGILTDLNQLKTEKLRGLMQLVRLSTGLAEVTGREFKNSPQHIGQLLLGQYGLPVLAWNEKELDDGTVKRTGPSFDKDTLKLYARLPQVIGTDAEHVIKLIREYREEAQYQSSFVEVLLENRDEGGRVHGTYNQNVRTGRMSCSRPGLQLQSERSKKLFHPGDGRAFVSADGSQIEFRVIAHFMGDPEVVRAYREDPDTDFHQWVASISGMQRAEAKSVNFAMAFGAGKAKTTEMMMANPDVMGSVAAEVEAMGLPPGRRAEEYRLRCVARANALWSTYHAKLPAMRSTAKAASENCELRGYVFNPFGRRRTLPQEAAFKAFNALVQSTASDICKGRMLELARGEYAADMLALDAHIVAQVHDEILINAPAAALPEVERLLASALPSTAPATFSVPFTWQLGSSTESWAGACLDSKAREKAKKAKKVT